MLMSMSGTLVMQDEKRGDSSKRPPLRLPIIAPKDDHSSSASSSRSGQLGGSGPTIPPRARLPPRSRTGCWTCRTRKVKCDEGRPVCGQCTRLGHNCDYSPRLSFRDDTPRVVERMQDVTVVSSSIWDPLSPTPTDTSTSSAQKDDLPPFHALVTDEDRERKAERSSPGTYNVVVNPDSFQHLPEYSDDPDIRKETLSPLRRGSIALSLASSLGRESAIEGIPLHGDPNIVVLPRFEDVPRRNTFSSINPRSPTSPVMSQAKIKIEDMDSLPPPFESSRTTSNDSLPAKTESKYIEQFREVVWRQLVPTEFDNSSVVIVEREATMFTPLAHAMMAVAALSMISRDVTARLDALQHYQQALPALQSTLQSTEDLSSDGAFLTHFLLLVYEIAAAEAEHSNMWSHHISTLLQISLLRRELFGGERYPFVVWWICAIDLDALFSGAGTGEYVGTMLKNDIVPPPSFHLFPLGADGSSVVYSTELESLPIILQLDYEVTILATRLALLAQEFRSETVYGLQNAQQRDRDTRLKQGRVLELQEQLRQLWIAPATILIARNVDALPARSKRLFEHASTLYRAGIIYSHTSMWNTQRLDTSPDHDAEIEVASNQILQITERVLSSGRTDCRYLVFPVFMAGYASTDGTQKKLALDLISRMETESIGQNAVTTRKLLTSIYERQNERFMTTGQSLDVDWMHAMIEENIIIVNFGL